MKSEKKYVYFFAANDSEGSADMKALLGGKGANLAEMCKLGIPVPPGFTLSTEVCTVFYKNKRKYPEGLTDEVDAHLKRVEKVMGKKFGDPKNPLLFSVRSGARASMPGMMDTVLNLGLNDKIAEGLVKLTKNARFVWDSYRRFVQMYGDVVLGLKPVEKDDIDPFEEIIERKKHEKGVELDTDLKTNDLKELVEEFKQAILAKTGNPFPDDPKEQLWGAIGAVFGSWMNDRAITYRRLNNIPAEWGTAVNVQSMVYGNMGNDSATGVAFTRDPSTGENEFYGEYLVNAQGEDVVAGIRTPQPINKAGKKSKDDVMLEVLMPTIYKQLYNIRLKLEKHYRDMQDIEFTIERGRLWMLQTRNGKRTASAALRIAVDMVKEKLISKEEAVMRVQPSQLDQLLHPTFDPKAKIKVLAKGLPASPGAASGRVVFNADDAEGWSKKNEKVILVRIETSPEDIGGMNAAEGILTARGGMTSHAAVVARGMGKCCVAGCKDISVNYSSRQFKVKDAVVKEGDWISLNGSTGEVIVGKVPTVMPEISGNFGKLMSWADEIKRLAVRTNADTPHDAKVARDFGAVGIGLCRTEHMFFQEGRIEAIREFILANDETGRKAALAKLLPMQTDDFVGIFEAMDGFPVTIRTIDPPLHEFLPGRMELQNEILDYKLALKNAENLDRINDLIKKIRTAEELAEKVESLHEINPMLGLRGCRLGILYPELTEMQARAIFEAACICKKKKIDARPEVMIPLITSKAELQNQKEIVVRVAEEIIARYGVEVDYMVGTMIELPRAALNADTIAEEAEFFSFGTNDLTQTTLGLSRDDAGKFLPMYVEKGIYEAEPFQQLDQGGVGKLIDLACREGRKTRKDLKLGICGEHGGDPSSVEFCHKVGLNYVSCSPYRVPIARLAAAQAVLKEKKK
ncbi:MAG TPA: pyruvate, phosphate dikinase [Cyclobacteriaceae bacterium]|nr:pyruvate, phosphate dikinase [Cyclobacteriaceae bacterium]